MDKPQNSPYGRDAPDGGEAQGTDGKRKSPPRSRRKRAREGRVNGGFHYE